MPDNAAPGTEPHSGSGNVGGETGSASTRGSGSTRSGYREVEAAKTWAQSGSKAKNFGRQSPKLGEEGESAGGECLGRRGRLLPTRGVRGQAKDTFRGGRGSERLRLDGVSPILLCFNSLRFNRYVLIARVGGKTARRRLYLQSRCLHSLSDSPKIADVHTVSLTISNDAHDPYK